MLPFPVAQIFREAWVYHLTEQMTSVSKTYLLYAAICFTITTLCSCGHYPKDTQGTLDNAKNGTLRVGTTATTTASDSTLAVRFAQQLNASVDWVHKDQQYLSGQLSEYKIDMAIGGFTEDSPFKKIVGLTKPYRKDGKKKYVIAIPKGENAFLAKLEQFIDTYEAP